MGIKTEKGFESLTFFKNEDLRSHRRRQLVLRQGRHLRRFRRGSRLHQGRWTRRLRFRPGLIRKRPKPLTASTSTKSSSSNHEFGDKRVDSNIEFKRPGLNNIHAWTNICPCGSDPTKEDPCLTSEAPLKKYPSKQCRSKRKGKKLTCKALCNGGAKASPNTVTSCYRESNNKPIGQWDFRRNNKGSC